MADGLSAVCLEQRAPVHPDLGLLSVLQLGAVLVSTCSIPSQLSPTRTESSR